MKNILTVIPARSNSKGIKDKNIIEINGKPLISYSIECSLKSKYVSRTIVNTDSESYMKIAKKYGAEVPYLRDKNMASDSVHAVFPVLETLKKLYDTENYNPDLIIMLLPTSPLRKVSTLDRAIEKYIELNKKIKSLVSVRALGKSKHHLRRVNGDLLLPFIKRNDYNIQRQEYENLFVLNGSIYISCPNYLLKYKTFHLENETAFFEMDEFESIDIDTYDDIKKIKKLIQIL